MTAVAPVAQPRMPAPNKEIESMQVYEILRSLELLRTMPEVDTASIAIVGKRHEGVNGLYAALLDGAVRRVILHTLPASHLKGPHYLGVLRDTDIAETASLLLVSGRVYAETPDRLRSARPCRTLEEPLQ
jgi:hypothetical protein